MGGSSKEINVPKIFLINAESRCVLKFILVKGLSIRIFGRKSCTNSPHEMPLLIFIFPTSGRLMILLSGDQIWILLQVLFLSKPNPDLLVVTLTASRSPLQSKIQLEKTPPTTSGFSSWKTVGGIVSEELENEEQKYKMTPAFHTANQLYLRK